MSKIVPKKKTKIPKTEEVKKSLPSAKERSWPRILSTIGLILGLAAIWFYFAAIITGHDGAKGPWELLTHPNYGQAAKLFAAMIVLTVLLNVKMKIISWKPARNLLIYASILVGIYVVAASIWPQFKPRTILANMGKGTPIANASLGPTALSDYKTYGPGTYTFSLKAGQKTDRWIMFPYGRITDYDISSDDNKFKLQYSDGEIVPAWTPGEWPEKEETKFKIIAVTDQPKIVMIVD